MAVTDSSRILAFGQDDDFLGSAGQRLGNAGFQFRQVRDPERVLAEVAAFQPHLIMLDRSAPGAAVAEVTRQLSGSDVPLLCVATDASQRELIRSVQAHAVEVMLKPFGEEDISIIVRLLNELAQRPPRDKATWEDQVARNYVDLARRRKVHGTLVVNRGTPFEGWALFREGQLVEAAYGPVIGMEAIREILLVEDGVWELDATLERPQKKKIAHSATELEPGKFASAPGSPSDVKPRLLVVDDEPDTLMLVAKALTRAGFEVSTADDGREALEMTGKTQFDLVIADLHMPYIDGWDLLKILKADHRTRDLPVIVLSAHDDLRETLRAGRAGAHDYLPKMGRSEPIVQAALKTITPRLEVLFALLVNEPVEVRTQVLGLKWFLRSLARLKATGVLELKDDWGRYRLEVEAGQPVAATAAIQERTEVGVPACELMVAATMAQGTFQSGPLTDDDVESGAFTPSMDELINGICERLNAAEARAAQQRLAGAELEVDPELYGLYLRIASPRKVAFAQAVCERKTPLAELARALEIPIEQAEESFRELLRRGVIRPERKGAGV